MKRHLGTLLLLITFATSILTACNSGEKASTIPADETHKTVVKNFSDSLKADTFTVKLIGTEPKNMKLAFTITAHTGKQIYAEQIKATDLFKNYDATIDLKKQKNQVKFLTEEVGRFFDDENFMEPAITDQETPDEHVPDKAFYNELKESQLNGFIYRLGKELKLYIGWSAKDNKVKTYYSCCK